MVFGKNLEYYAITVFCIAVYPDYLDGYTARKLNQESPNGAFWDATVDKIFVYSLFLYFVSLEMIDIWIVLIALSRDFYVTILRTLSKKFGFILQANMYGKTKFCFQVTALFSAILTLVIFDSTAENIWRNAPTVLLIVAIFVSMPGVPLLTKQFFTSPIIQSKLQKHLGSF